MANRTLYPAKFYGSGRVYAEFRFTAPGAGTSVTVSTVSGSNIVASIAHVGGTNKLTVTLKDSFNKVIDIAPEVLSTTGKWATAGGILNEGTATAIVFDLYTWVAAGTVDNDCAADITVKLALRDGSWGVQ